MTLAVPAGRPIESGERASLSHSDSGPVETTAAAAETSLQLRSRAVVFISSEDEKEEEMLRRCRPRVVIEDLEALAFRDQTPDAPQPASDAPSLPSAPAHVAPTSVPTSPAVVASTLALVIPLSVGDRKCAVDISDEEGRPEKRLEIEASPSSLAEPSSQEVAPQSPWPSVWRPDLEADIGRPRTWRTA